MTEDEWDGWRDPWAALRAWRHRTGEPGLAAFTGRKLRLFAVACSRQVRDRWTHPSTSAAVDAAELLADARTNEQRRRCQDARGNIHRTFPRRDWSAEVYLASDVLRGNPWVAAIFTSSVAGVLAAGEEDIPWGPTPDVALAELAERGRAARVRQRPLLDDVIGHPLRPACWDRRWRTASAVALARTMYDGRDFAHLPILADALEDAGCADEAVIGHCRDPEAVHVRGCWVVDLVLGKA